MTVERGSTEQGNRRPAGRRRLGIALLVLASAGLTACAAAEGADEPALAAPEACVDTADASRNSVEGTPVWVRFCPGPERYTEPAEVPSDALTTHLDLLAGLEERPVEDAPAGWPCSELAGGRSYEVQIGYADGEVATIAGRTDPECTARLAGGAGVGGPEGLGVYGLLMTAFGQQYADGFEDATGGAPLACPEDPRNPDSADVDGGSTALDTGYLLGERAPMVMPLTAVRGIVCTWPSGAGGEEPAVRELTPDEAERVRIGLHAIMGGTVDCEGTPEPTYTAVVEDRTGTRRAVTVDDGMCSTVLRSDGGYGVGFAWLER